MTLYDEGEGGHWTLDLLDFRLYSIRMNPIPSSKTTRQPALFKKANVL